MKDQPGCDFGKHIIPYCHENGNKICAYDFKGYWKDVGTLGSYWEANMELVDIVPEFNLYEEFWKIYTKTDAIPPQYIVSEGDKVYHRRGNRDIWYCGKLSYRIMCNNRRRCGR